MDFIKPLIELLTAVLALLGVIAPLYINKKTLRCPVQNPAEKLSGENILKEQTMVGTNAAERRRRLFTMGLGLSMVFLAIGNLTWLELGPARSAPLTSGDAASVAGSLLLAYFGFSVVKS